MPREAEFVVHRQSAAAFRRSGSVRIFTERELTADFRRRHYRRMFEAQKGLCYLCGEGLAQVRLGNHLDHVIALSRGGRTEWKNLKLAHAVCNLRKGAK